MNKILLLLCLPLFSLAQAPKAIGPAPNATQLAWHEKEFYLFMHFGPNTFTGKEWGEGKENPDEFNPTNLDCKQWARIAKQAGAKGIIITAKHHDGFCLWPSKYSKHTVRESKWKNGKGDVLRELADACKEIGIEMGVYISPWDRNHPSYGTPAYNDVFINMMKELFQNYGPFFELWWDGANGEGPNGKKQVYDFNRFEKVAFQLQPNLIIFSDIGPSIRWCGNENGIIGNTNWNLLDTAGFKRGEGAPTTDTLNSGNRNGQHWMPAEADVSIRPGWFYRPEEDSKVKTAPQLFDLYTKSVGNGGNLLLNVPPDRNGLIHPIDSTALMQFRLMRDKAFANNLLSKASIKDQLNKPVMSLNDGNAQTYWTGNGKNPSLVIQFAETTDLNCLVLEEFLNFGQRIGGFVVENWNGKQYETLATATTMGRKKILRFSLIEAKQIRIRFTDLKAAPLVRNISGYRVPF
ncbi:MAG: alpha-L-fucosidase [Chitinophagaceae bacterium]